MLMASSVDSGIVFVSNDGDVGGGGGLGIEASPNTYARMTWRMYLRQVVPSFTDMKGWDECVEEEGVKPFFRSSGVVLRMRCQWSASTLRSVDPSMRFCEPD